MADKLESSAVGTSDFTFSQGLKPLLPYPPLAFGVVIFWAMCTLMPTDHLSMIHCVYVGVAITLFVLTLVLWRRLPALRTGDNNGSVEGLVFLGQIDKRPLGVANSRGFTIHSVHRLWADPVAGSSVSAKLDSNGWLHITFACAASTEGYPCDVEIRPGGRSAVTVGEAKWLCVELQAQAKCRIALRLIDARGTHWVRTLENHGADTCSSAEIGPSRQKVILDLDPARSVWHVFQGDGNFKTPLRRDGRSVPDFAFLSAFVIEMGMDGRIHRTPATGSGEITLYGVSLLEARPTGPDVVEL